jgi:Na+/H+ antiporter NhaD/arsenite permease-like protein
MIWQDRTVFGPCGLFLCTAGHDTFRVEDRVLNTFVLIVLALMYAGIILFPARKAWISMGAAAVLMVGGAVTPGHAFGSLVNWNILCIYLGSLVLAELFIYSRVPAFIAERIVERSPSIGVAITIILLLAGLVSAFVENVATVLVVAPVMIELAKRGKKNLAPLMIGLAVMANLQGTATLVGDPPSMIFANYAGYSFNDFFFKFGKPSIFFAIQAGAIVGAAYFFFYFRSMQSDIRMLPSERIVSWIPSLLLVAMIAGLALFSALSKSGGIHPISGIFVLGLAVLGLVWLAFIEKEPREAQNLVRHVDWGTLAFLVGIFIVVGTLSESGLLEELAGKISVWVGGNLFLGFALIVMISVLISGFVDNVPYIAAMLPVASSLARAMQVAPELMLFGLLVGSCLGGNLTPFGASANIVAVSLSEKQGSKINFWQWLKFAGPFTILTTIAASGVIWILWR